MAENNGVFIGGLWQKETKNGVWYLKGGFGTADIFIFPNDRKQNENQPDYSMKIVPKQERNNGGGNRGGQQQRRSGPPQQQQRRQGGGPPPASTNQGGDYDGMGVGDDDVPF